MESSTLCIASQYIRTHLGIVPKSSSGKILGRNNQSFGREMVLVLWDRSDFPEPVYVFPDEIAEVIV